MLRYCLIASFSAPIAPKPQVRSSARRPTPFAANVALKLVLNLALQLGCPHVAAGVLSKPQRPLTRCRKSDLEPHISLSPASSYLSALSHPSRPRSVSEFSFHSWATLYAFQRSPPRFLDRSNVHLALAAPGARQVSRRTCAFIQDTLSAVVSPLGPFQCLS